MARIDCTSASLVYLIHCIICDATNVGESVYMRSVRLEQHRHAVACVLVTPVAKQYNQPGHTMHQVISNIEGTSESTAADDARKGI